MELPILFAASSGVCAGAVADLIAREHEVWRAPDVAAAGAACRRRVPAAVVLTYPGAAPEGPFLGFLREHARRTPVFVCGERGPLPQEVAYRALAAGACRVLDAGADDFADELHQRLERLLRDLEARRQEQGERAKLFAPFDVVGASPAMHDVFCRALKASRLSDLPVLIEGESGTPKRRLANAVLCLDRARVTMPCFILSCAGLDRVLANESAGGRTVAPAARWRDLLRAARGGMVYLDEVGRLGAELQGILLEEAREAPGEVRVIAASERPLEELVREGVLDAELSAWLGLFRIPLPALRGRPEDVEAQARHVLHTTQAGRARPVTDFGPGVLERLQRLPWEGNTRQLEAVLRRALGAKAGDAALTTDDLPEWVREAEADGPLPEPMPHPGDWDCPATREDARGLELAADEFERRIRAYLGRPRGRVSQRRPEGGR